MSKSKKLLLAVTTLFFAVCLSLLVAGCNNGAPEHTHSYAEEWSYNDSSHWHAATCEHTTQKSAFAKHVDADDDGKCDVCNYVMHTHTFNTSIWSHDASTHWHPADCGHDLKADEAAHVDEDGDEFCDICEEPVPHVHKFSTTEWQFTESTHWRPATCGHSEKSSEGAHSFTAGVCECGVKQSEVDVYNALVSLEKTEADFVEWLGELSEEGVTSVRLTALGDIIYEKASGSEAVYVADRTVKVKAEDQSKQPVAGVYVKVTCKINGVVHKNGTTDALAIGVTDENGVAEIKFTPIDLSSDTVEYTAKIPEELDIEQVLHISEEDASAVPNRYLYKDEENIIPFEITGDKDGEEIGALKLTYSRGIEAYKMLNLPYRRFYQNPIRAEGLTENKVDLTFKASGDRLYDYITFTPYDVPPAYAPYRHPADADTIINNSEEAASGIYKISFSVEGEANATLYFWNEGGFDPNVSTYVSPEGIPLEKYLTAVSGEGEGEIYTGVNSIEVTVEQEFATKSYQLAILADAECTVTVSVVWLYSVDDVVDYEIDWNDAEGDALTSAQLVLAKYSVTKIGLKNFEPGLYKISLLNELGAFTKSADKYRIYTNDRKDDEMMLWEHTRLAASTDEYKGILRFTDSTARLFINNLVTVVYADLKIEKYELPELGTEPEYLPVTISSAEKYNIPLSSSLNGDYTVQLIVCGKNTECNKSYEIIVYINDRQYTLTTEDNCNVEGCCVYTGSIRVEEGDTHISMVFRSAMIPYSLMAQTTLTKAA